MIEFEIVRGIVIAAVTVMGLILVGAVVMPVLSLFGLV